MSKTAMTAKAPSTSTEQRTPTAPATSTPTQACAAYSWCRHTGQHQDHVSTTVAIPAPSDFPEVDRPYLGASLFDGGDGKVIASVDCGTWLDLDASGLRAEIAKIREHLPKLEALADQLAAIEGSPTARQEAAAAEITRTITESSDPQAAARQFLDSLETRTAASSRTLPATVRGQRIYVDCPSWCTVDHAATDEHFIEDLTHSSESTHLPVPVYRGSPEPVLLASLGMSTDDASRPVLTLDGSADGEAAELPLSQARAFLDDYAAHGQRLRRLVEALAAVEGEHA